MSQNAPTRSSQDRIAKWLAYVLRVLFDPIVFAVLLGPLIIGNALFRLLGAATIEFRGAGNYERLLEFLGHPDLPGTVDYAVQYYTAILAFCLWLAKAIRDVWYPILTHKQETPSKWVGTYALLAFALGVFGIWTFFTGAADPSILELYIANTTSFDSTHLPPFSSPLTLLRIALFILAVPLAVISSRRQGEC